MKKTMLKAAIAGLTLTLAAGVVPALADGGHNMHKGHEMGGHDMMKMNMAKMNSAGAAKMNSAGARGTIPVNAVINKINAAKGSVNVTHDPIPALKWPSMTMDLPVTKRVDLSKLKAGASVILSLKQGRDKQYRIAEITPAK